MKINLTTQTEILTITDEDLDKDYGYLSKYFDEELKNEPEETIIKTFAYNVDREELVLLIFNKKEGFTHQKKIILEDVEPVEPV